MFVDTNILIFSTQETSPRHRVANTILYRLHEQSVPLWVSRQILREYLASVTRPQQLQQPLPLENAISDVRRFEKMFIVVEDSPAITRRLLALLEAIPARGAQVHDANIVATMLEHGIDELLTDNVADFVRFHSVIKVVGLNA